MEKMNAELSLTLKRTLRRNNNKITTPTFCFSLVPAVPPGSAPLVPLTLLVPRIPLEAHSSFQWKLTEQEMSWILKSFDDNLKLDGSKRAIMHLLWEKLQLFLDIRESTWELSLKVQAEKRRGFFSCPAYGADYSLLTCYLGFECFFYFNIFSFFSLFILNESCLSSDGEESVSFGQREFRVVKNETLAAQKAQEGEQK